MKNNETALQLKESIEKSKKVLQESKNSEFLSKAKKFADSNKALMKRLAEI